MFNQSEYITGHGRIFVSGLLSWLTGSTEASHVGNDSTGADGQQRAYESWSTFGRGIGKWKSPAEQVTEHRLALFQERKNTIEVSKLAEPVDKAAVEQDDSGSLAQVVIGDLDSVKRGVGIQ